MGANSACRTQHQQGTRLALRLRVIFCTCRRVPCWRTFCARQVHGPSLDLLSCTVDV